MKRKTLENDSTIYIIYGAVFSATLLKSLILAGSWAFLIGVL